MSSERDYPTEAELNCITGWDYKDPRGWFDYIRGIWWMPDWGFWETPRQIRMSTGGWSGNSEIVHAMRANFALWSQYWVSVRAGGHYVFKKPRRKNLR